MRSSILSLVLLLANTMAEKLLYRNTFKDQDSIKDWVAEGPLKATVSNNSTSLNTQYHELSSRIMVHGHVVPRNNNDLSLFFPFITIKR